MDRDRTTGEGLSKRKDIFWTPTPVRVKISRVNTLAQKEKGEKTVPLNSLSEKAKRGRAFCSRRFQKRMLAESSNETGLFD